MYDVARPVARRFILNSVWLTYAVVRFVVRRLTSLYNYCQCLVARDESFVSYFNLSVVSRISPRDNSL
jgi:hypothetical protein